MVSFRHGTRHQEKTSHRITRNNTERNKKKRRLAKKIIRKRHGAFPLPFFRVIPWLNLIFASSSSQEFYFTLRWFFFHLERFAWGVGNDSGPSFLPWAGGFFFLVTTLRNGRTTCLCSKLGSFVFC